VNSVSQPSGVPNQLDVGIGGQIGTTTYGTNGWGQSGSVGVAVYFEACYPPPEPDYCPIDGDEGAPFFSAPDSYSAGTVVGGGSVNTDGGGCVTVGPTFTWPPLAPNWNIP